MWPPSLRNLIRHVQISLPQLPAGKSMSGKSAFPVLVAIVLCIVTYSASAQIVTCVADVSGIPAMQVSAPYTFRPSVDADIRQMRNNAVPGFRYRYDDYLQYSPAVLMVGLKSLGFKGRSSWGRMLVSDAFSAGIMAVTVNGAKYSVRRLRPDGSSRNSFPSGHTATAFMTATMLHKEYGWRSPWFSIGGYAAATVTGVSRILNNRHWMSDVLLGGAIGIGSVHLGYFLGDLIFRERQLHDGYERPDAFAYDEDRKYYEAGLSFSRRFVLGTESDKSAGVLPRRGSSAAILGNIPVVPGTGVSAKISANEFGFATDASGEVSYNMYNAMAGIYWQYAFPKLVNFELNAMLGYAWHDTKTLPETMQLINGMDVMAEAAVALRAGEDFRIKAFAGYETFRFSVQKPWLNSFLLGFSASFCW